MELLESARTGELKQCVIPVGGLILDASGTICTSADEPLALVLSVDEKSRRLLVLVTVPAASAVRVNGRPSTVAVLQERDEVSVGTARFRASTPLSLIPAPLSAGTDTSCGRCKASLVAGDLVIRCACGAHLHEGPRADATQPALFCFSHASTCPCGRSAGEWSPDDGDA